MNKTIPCLKKNLYEDITNSLLVLDDKLNVKEKLMLIVGEKTEQISCMCLSYDENNEEMVKKKS
jgi:hypothetical protein